tara:strand:- start:821 stop:1270 length:450 start_codon:yes stop_codon:yes gene_type:complete
MLKTIPVKTYAELTQVSANEVIAKINSGDLKGHSKAFAWYVDEVDTDNLKIEVQKSSEKHNIQEKQISTPTSFPIQDARPSDAPTSDLVANSLYVIAWIILGCGSLLALFLIQDSLVIATVTVGASLFQSLLLMGFSRIINYLKIIAEK